MITIYNRFLGHWGDVSILVLEAPFLINSTDKDFKLLAKIGHLGIFNLIQIYLIS